MTMLQKILGAFLLVLAVFLGGYFYGKQDVQVVTQEKIVYREGETHTVYKDRIVTVTRTVKPDGTVTETTRTEDKDKTKDTKTETAGKDKTTTVTPILAKYSLGLFTRVHLPELGSPLNPDVYSVGVSAGYRLYKPVWLKIGAVPADKYLTLGIEVEL